MLNEKEINQLLQLQGMAEIYNQMLTGLVAFASKIVGDEDIAHNYIYGLWDLDRVIAKLQEGTGND